MTRFCEEVLSPIFQAHYDHVEIWQYSQRKSSKTVGLIRSIDSMSADYLLLGDIDERPCVTVTKEELNTQFSVLSSDRVIVVRREIEAWYLAGLHEPALRDLGLARGKECRRGHQRAVSIAWLVAKMNHTKHNGRNPQTLRRRSRPPEESVIPLLLAETHPLREKGHLH